MTKYVSEPSIVLNVTRFREADLSLTLLCKNLGKTAAIARHARNSKKRFMGGIDLFEYAVFDLSLSKPDETTYTVNSLSQKIVWEKIRSSLDKLCLSAFIIEITNAFISEGDPEGGKILKPLFNSLKTLDQQTNSEVYITACIYFTLELLRHSGYDPTQNNSNDLEKFQTWWEELLTSKSSIPPPNPQYLTQSLDSLASVTEQIIGKKLKTRKDLAICHTHKNYYT